MCVHAYMFMWLNMHLLPPVLFYHFAFPYGIYCTLLVLQIILHIPFLLLGHMIFAGQDPMIPFILELPEIPCVNSIGKISTSHLDYVSIVCRLMGILILPSRIYLGWAEGV